MKVDVINISKTEQILTEIWKECLGLEHIDVHSNFFEIGGDSIKAMEILAKMKKEIGAVNLQKLFMYQTIAEIARYMDSCNLQMEQAHKVDTKVAEFDEIMEMLE